MKNTALLIVVIFIAALTQLATDIYTPSLPAIATDLSATMGQVQMTIPLFIMGLTACNLIYGPLSETIGRHRITGQ
jgi:DHA1 family bicyclomycin/chloramphenicol resistance-like MFS transporter